jgi:hypothetical protein
LVFSFIKNLKIIMKNYFLLSIIIIGVITVFFFTNFKFQQDDNSGNNFSVPIDSLHPHDAQTDYNPNLVIPPYVYYPPLPDNPLLYQNIDICGNTAPQNEPSVKISQKNPNRVVAAWRDFRIGFNPAYRRVGYSYSSNGGQTWAPSALLDSTLLTGLLRNSDAAVTVDTAGNFYITTIALNNVNSNTTLAIYKSTDGGVTFPTAQILAQGYSEDKEMITTDLVPGSPYKNNLYISWSRLNLSPDIRLIRSSDGGQTWSPTVNVSTTSTNGQGSDPAVGINGEVYVTWTSYSYNTEYFNKSTDGGLTFGTPVTVATGAAGNIPWSQGGTTQFPSIACDVSGGPRNGYIYIVWCDGRNSDEDCFLSRSTDHGVTWSAPTRINNDPVSNGKVQAWPWIAVNDSGRIAVTFYDTRNTPDNNTIEAWLARSSDGGVTFMNEVISTQQSPTNKPNTDVRFGDYISCDFWHNKIVPVWTDERAGGYDQSIYTAVIDLAVGTEPIVSKIPSGFELKQNYPNPFNPSTTISFNLPQAGNIELSIFDINGKLVSKVYNGMMNAGAHSITWDGSNFSSGVYFYKLSEDNFTETKKMLMIK